MRKAESKDYGYVIVPVAIPPGIDDPERVLDDAKTYKVVWSVLRALRAHDSKRFEQRMLDGNVLSDVIIWEPPEPCTDCQHGICSRHVKKEGCKDCAAEYEGSGKPCKKHAPRTSTIMDIPTHLIQSKIVEKISDRRYLENWADDVANIVSRSTSRINELYESNKKIRSELDGFHAGLKKIINDAISHDDAVDMLSQHMVMERVFDALFKKENFTEHNPISKTMNRILESLATKGLKAEMEDLEKFYNDIDAKVSSIQTHEARQKVIHQLYDKFFNNAFKKTAERLGIVYTPIEIVDFILKSVDYAMRENFGRGLSARNVNVIDPFTGTGSFITRLMSKELNLIKDRDLEHKYKNSLFANEIVLLAYYIAAINCESTFFERYNQYMPFGGITLTDTFHAKKIDDEWNEGLFTETQKRIEKQRASNITVVISNPPYSAGQKDSNHMNKNLKYPVIDDRIKNTYLKKLREINPKFGLVRSIYDSYVRSIRWASDRIGDSGVIGFVTNASFIRSDTAAGIRACLKEEFTDVWVFDLLGKKGLEGHGRNVFEYPGVSAGGTTTQIAIIILVKNPDKKKHTIHYRALTKTEYSGPDKRLEIKKLGSIENIKDWQEIEPDKHHDWLDHRSDEFENYLPMGSKGLKAGKGNAVFEKYSGGVNTSRDAWVYNSSVKMLSKNMKRHVEYCIKYISKRPNPIDPQRGKWSGDLSEKLQRFGKPTFSKSKIRVALYRPFFKQYFYFDKTFNNAQNRTSKFFPKPNSKNLLICVPYKGVSENFSTLVTDKIPDLHIIAQNRCFPLYAYENNTRKDNITNYTLEEYKTHYKNKKISKIDIFYYIYGLLHHTRYKEKYANNLSKVLPHIPMAPDFWTFSKIGKKLADLHLSWETCKRHNLGKPKYNPKKFIKMSFAKKKDGEKTIMDKSVLIVDGNIVFENIPNIKYRINGRTPIDWAIDRYKIHNDKSSGIVNDATDIDVIPLIERLVYIGVESDRLVLQLPKEFESKNWKPKKTGLDAYSTSK
ncbi:MAG: N-6 DNA methylase, partial [Thaumarchaeota archaeon]|nr:N-6 DNA methylase [Nitrososphaerota archaeon]